MFYNIIFVKLFICIMINSYICNAFGNLTTPLITKQRQMILKNNIDTNEVIAQIQQLWNQLTDNQARMIEETLCIRQFKKGEFIYRGLCSPEHIMYLVEGKVKVFKDGIGGRNQIIRVVKPTEFFGYRAHFAQEDYKTSAMSFEPCIVAFIPTSVIDNLIQENPCVNIFFIRQLSKELGASNARIVNLTQKHIRGRLAEALLYLKDTYGVEEDGNTLSIHLSREDLANLSNMTTSNAIRTLSCFAAENLIAIEGKKIKFIKEDELQKISAIG